MSAAAIVVGVLLLVTALVIWRRFSEARADRHSITTYEHTLGVLGEVTRRSAPSSSVRVVPSRDDASAPLPEVHPARREPRLDPLKGREITPPAPPMEIVRALAHVERPAASGEQVEAGGELARGEPARGPGREWRERSLAGTQLLRKGLTGGLSAAAVAVIAFATVQILGHHSPPAAGRQNGVAGTTHTSTTPAPRATSTLPRSTTTTLPDKISPQNASTSDVSYVAPASSYSISLSASGPCWVGIEKTVSGPWVWMDTLAAGQSTTYQATGKTVVRVGAPAVLRVAIDGITVVLPPSNTQPYDMIFNPQG